MQTTVNHNQVILNRLTYKKQFMLSFDNEEQVTKLAINLLYFTRSWGTAWRIENGESTNFDIMLKYITESLTLRSADIFIRVNRTTQNIEINPDINPNDTDYEVHHISFIYQGKTKHFTFLYTH